MRIGSTYKPDGGTLFTVWAPHREEVSLHLHEPEEAVTAMKKGGRGYWHLELDRVEPGSLYTFLLDGEAERPDPASHLQPRGVHGPSAVVEHQSFPWSDDGWRGLALEDHVFYELHVGTFTPEGTFDAVVPRLGELRDLGITALEIMPVSQFPGTRNWGYDGVYPFAVQASYGGPTGLKRLVDACHGAGLAVFLDVVYNHLGPEGNYLAEFGPYFTETYRTPWGSAVNFDGPWSDEVRNYFLENALHWFEHYRLDGLRLDAVHAIYDVSARPFLQELAETVDGLAETLGRKLHLVAESNRNDVRFVRPRQQGGTGLHAEWCDDFHHSLHALLTGERSGYYADFGDLAQLAKALSEGFVYSGQFSRYRLRRHGSPSAEVPGRRFVVFAQNHDQTGNRMLGERLSSLVSFDALKLTAGAILASPYLPLLFMGEEYGENAPFLYFVDHGDPGLVAAVREGRKAEFESFGWKQEPPDPQDAETFGRSRITWEDRERGQHATLLALHRELLRLRREIPALSNLDKSRLEVGVAEEAPLLHWLRWCENSRVLGLLHFAEQETVTVLPSPAPSQPGAHWQKVVDTADPRWGGPGTAVPEQMASGAEIRLSPLCFLLFCEAKAP